MDSKNIFIACSAMLQKTNWEKASEDSEWYHLGEGGEMNLALAESKVSDFFSNESLYIVIDRHLSKEISKADALAEIQNVLNEHQEVTVCNKEFQKFITFNKIGVARNGIARVKAFGS